MSYNPNPKETNKIVLSPDLLAMIEEIAENTHEVWAKNRLNDGWVYGTVYDGNKKTHPCLVPYDQLPESEKDFDRSTSTQVIKFLIMKGFEIIKKGE